MAEATVKLIFTFCLTVGMFGNAISQCELLNTNQSPQFVCGSGSFTFSLSENGDTPFGTYTWYNSTGVIQNAFSTSYTTPTLSTNESYYVVVDLNNGCPVNTYFFNTNIVNTSPPNLVGVNASVCPYSSAVVRVLPVTGFRFEWYELGSSVKLRGDRALGDVLSTGQTFSIGGISNSELTVDNVISTISFSVVAIPESQGPCQGGNSSITVAAIALPLPNSAVSLASQSLCTGQPMTSIAITNPNVVSGTVFNWTVSAPNITGATPGAGTLLSQNLTNTTNANQTAIYTITPSANGCVGTAVTHTVTVKPTPTVAVSLVSQSICSGQPMTSVTITSPSEVSGTTFGWTVSASNITGATVGSGTSLTHTLANLTNVNQTAIYTITPTANGCAGAPATHTVTVRPTPTVAVSLASQSICTSQPMASVTITNPNAVSGTTFNWTVSAPNITGATAGSGATLSQTLTNATSTNQTATYTITPTANGCAGTPATHTVTVKPTPTVAVSLASQSICSGQPMTSVTITNPNGVSGTTFSWTVSAPNITGATAGSGTTLSQTLTNATSTNQTATYTITPTASACAGTSATHTVTVKPTPTAAVSLASQSICTSQPMASITITNPNAVSGTTFNWTVSAPNITGATAGSGTTLMQTLTNTTNLNQTAIYTIIPTASGCTGAAVVHSVTVNPIPTLSSSLNPLPIASGSTFDYTATSSVVGATFAWSRGLVNGIVQAPSNGSGNVSEILVNNTTANVTVNYLFVTTANGCSSSSQTVSVIVQAPVVVTQNENYIITNTLLEPQTDVNVVENLLVNQRSQSFQYFDGLGRPMQTVSTQGSPNKKDIVQAMAYDAFGRESKKYLPYVASTSTDGWYKPNALRDPQSTFTDPEALYRTGAQWQYYQSATKVAGDTRPYTETVFEASPLNRPDNDFGVGQNWKDNNKFIHHQYLINVNGTLANQERVIAWKVDATGLPIRETAVNTAVSGGYYTTGQLNIKSTKDEQGNEVREYVDKEGRTILKKVQAVSGIAQTNNDTHWAITYYIYDDLGNLAVVLPPEAVKAIAQP